MQERAGSLRGKEHKRTIAPPVSQGRLVKQLLSLRGPGTPLAANAERAPNDVPATPPIPRRWRWPDATLRTYLVAMSLLASVPMALFMSLQILRDVRGQYERLEASLARSAGAVSQAIERELDSSFEALEMVADRGEPDPVPALAQRMGSGLHLRPSWQSVFILDEAGRVLASAGAPSPWVLSRATSSVAEGGGRDVSPLVEHGVQRAVAVTVPLGERHRLGAWIPASHWQQLLQRFASRPDGFATLYDEDHRVIARTPDPERSIGQSLPASAIDSMGDRTGHMQRVPLGDGGVAFAAWKRVGDTGWGIGVGVPVAPIERQHLQAMLGAFGTAALCLLAGVGLALWMARRVTGPLVAMAGGAPVAQAAASPVREIAALGRALAHARDEEASARERLQRQADEFEALFRASPVGLAFAQDNNARRVLRNRALDELLEPPAEANGRPLQVLQAGQVRGWDQLPLAIAARSGRRVPATELELRFGDARHARIVIMQTVPLLDADGRSRGAIGALVDITDRKRAEARLIETDHERAALVQREQAARREAEAANQAKDEFLAMLGHELRNPLNAVASAVEVLKLVGGGGARAEDARDIISRQTRHLAHLMDDLLDMARVASGKAALERRPMDLGKLVSSLAATMQLSGNAREHGLSLAIEETWIDADPTRIEQVASNLLTNAFKYTPAGGRVGVRVFGEGPHAVLEVSDTGLGIAPELLSRAFDLFVQGERTLDRRAGGLGVGLTLVRRLVELHGGRVNAESNGQGSLFRVTLPRIVPPPPAAVPGAAVRQRPRSVLLVEDNDDALQALLAVLELDGHQVDTEADGQAGLDRLLATRPEIAVIDLGLPKLTGFELARRARAAGYAGRLVALSGYGMETNTRQAMQSGFDAHLTKPVDFDRLRELLDD